jgi:phosphoribosylcarboxyaminoimidazole (NCAIR) mutase
MCELDRGAWVLDQLRASFTFTMSIPNCGVPHQSGTIGGADSKPVASQLPRAGEPHFHNQL